MASLEIRSAPKWALWWWSKSTADAMSVAFVLVVASVATANPLFAAELGPGQERELLRVRAELADAPDSVRLHRQLQDLLLHNRYQARHEVTLEYARRLYGQSETAGNRYLVVRLIEGPRGQQAQRDLIRDYPKFPWGYFGLAAALMDQEAYVEARDLLSKAIDLAPDVPELYAKLADAYGNDSQYQAALDETEKALTRFPESPHLSANRVWYLRLLDRYPEAQSFGQEALKENPGDRWLLYFTGLAFFDDDQYAKAIPFFDAGVKEWPGHSGAWLKLCIARGEATAIEYKGYPQGSPLKAACEHAAAKNPEDWRPPYFLSLAWNNDRSRGAAHAAYYAQKALRLSLPENPKKLMESVNSSAMDRLSGSTYPIEARYPEGFVTSRRALGEADRRALSNHGSAAAWAALEQAMQVPDRQSLNTLVNEFPDFAPAYFNRAILGLEIISDLNPTAEFKRAVELAPEWGRALGGLAARMMRDKQFTPARLLLRAARKADPDDTTIRYNAELMKKFDIAVVERTVFELRQFLAYAQETGERDFLTDVWGGFRDYLRRDPTSHRILEAFGDIEAASKVSIDWYGALENYKKAIEMGADPDRVGAKFAEVEERLK